MRVCVCVHVCVCEHVRECACVHVRECVCASVCEKLERTKRNGRGRAADASKPRLRARGAAALCSGPLTGGGSSRPVHAR